MDEENASSNHYGLDAMNRQQHREQYVSMKSNVRTDAGGSIGEESFSTSDNYRRESIMTKVRRKGTMPSGGIGSIISGKPLIQPDGSISLL